MKLSILALSAVYAQEEPTSILWPAQAPWSDRMWCGSQTTLEVAVNSTCTVTLNKGKAAWLNAGGAFFNGAGTQDTFTIHTYSDTQQIPLTVFYEMTELADIESIPFNQWGQPAYPTEWQAECFLKRDQKVQDPASINCVDNGGQVEGVFLMGFTYNNNGEGAQNIQIQNTDGHKRGSMYTLTLRSRSHFSGEEGPAIGAATTSANGTVIPGADRNTLLVVLDEDYNGELLPVTFEYANAPLANFEPYQAAWSDVVVS